ncbi:MAG TPA: DUF5684 domain-containing protein [Lachnospiraceae bacterium]|nr:DUF5684 domain-containing protein [Lachnospiraceae bacterium]
MDSSIIAMMLAMGTAVVIFCLILYVLYVIAYWKLFTKAGEAGWKSIIPIYNGYILYKIGWQVKWFWIVLGLGVISNILSAIGGNSPVVIIIVICTLMSVAAGIISGIIFNLKLAKAYGKGTGFGIGLIFLNTIFVFILAFGDSKYVGAQE